MKVNIDFSIFTEAGDAMGNVVGVLNFQVTPEIGDTISFGFPKNKLPFPRIKKFNGMVKISNRIISPNQECDEVLLSLEDVVIVTKEEGRMLIDYLESGFDLFFNEN